MELKNHDLSRTGFAGVLYDEVPVRTPGGGTAESKKKDDPKAAPSGETKVAALSSATEDAGAPTTGKRRPPKVVFVVTKETKVEMRVVKTGIASRTDVEILEGVNEGETVVDGPYRTLARELKDGQSVKLPSKDGGTDEPSKDEGRGRI